MNAERTRQTNCNHSGLIMKARFKIISVYNLHTIQACFAFCPCSSPSFIHTCSYCILTCEFKTIDWNGSTGFQIERLVPLGPSSHWNEPQSISSNSTTTSSGHVRERPLTSTCWTAVCLHTPSPVHALMFSKWRRLSFNSTFVDISTPTEIDVTIESKRAPRLADSKSAYLA